MIKKLCSFLFFFVCCFAIIPTVYACDPIGCIMGGHQQDALLLGEVVEMNKEKAEINIFFVFPQNTVNSLQEGDTITVHSLKKDAVENGGKYLFSLKMDDSEYVPAWGIYEIDGIDYTDAQLIEKNSTSTAALQAFIHSGGTHTDFYVDGGKLLLRSDDGSSALIYRKKNMFILLCSTLGALLLTMLI